jgi:DNA-binding transcriptional ArsR family regulator
MPFGKFLKTREMVKQSDAGTDVVQSDATATRPVDLLAELKPGIAVSLSELSEKTGLTVEEVREHLLSLEQLGLVTIIEAEGHELALATEQGAQAL